MEESLREVWSSILKCPVDDSTDFFGCGAGSMHVVQLVEEVKERAGELAFLLVVLFFPLTTRMN